MSAAVPRCRSGAGSTARRCSDRPRLRVPRRTRPWDPPTSAPTASTATPRARPTAAPSSAASQSVVGQRAGDHQQGRISGRSSEPGLPVGGIGGPIATRSISHGEVLEHVTARADGPGGQVRGPSHEPEHPSHRDHHGTSMTLDPPSDERPVLRSSHRVAPRHPVYHDAQDRRCPRRGMDGGGGGIRVSVQGVGGASRPAPHRVPNPTAPSGACGARPLRPVVRRGRVRVYGDLPLVAWPSGLGKGLQSPVRGFDSRRHLHLYPLVSAMQLRRCIESSLQEPAPFRREMQDDLVDAVSPDEPSVDEFPSQQRVAAVALRFDEELQECTKFGVAAARSAVENHPSALLGPIVIPRHGADVPIALCAKQANRGQPSGSARGLERTRCPARTFASTASTGVDTSRSTSTVPSTSSFALARHKADTPLESMNVTWDRSTTTRCTSVPAKDSTALTSCGLCADVQLPADHHVGIALDANLKNAHVDPLSLTGKNIQGFSCGTRGGPRRVRAEGIVFPFPDRAWPHGLGMAGRAGVRSCASCYVDRRRLLLGYGHGPSAASGWTEGPCARHGETSSVVMPSVAQPETDTAPRSWCGATKGPCCGLEGLATCCPASCCSIRLNTGSA